MLGVLLRAIYNHIIIIIQLLLRGAVLKVGFRVQGLGVWMGVSTSGSCRDTSGAYRAYVVVSQNKGPSYKPQNTLVLVIGTPKMVPLILGNP